MKCTLALMTGPVLVARFVAMALRAMVPGPLLGRVVMAGKSRASTS